MRKAGNGRGRPTETRRSPGGRIFFGLAVLLLVGIAGPRPSPASETPGGGTFSFVVENDWFGAMDRHYTSGIQLAWAPGPGVPVPGWAGKLARLLPRLPEGGETRHEYSIGQSTFTPWWLTTPDPIPTDRPYAGWLYGTIALDRKSGGTTDRFWITLGIVGPASLAGRVHKTAHKVLDMDEPQGWDRQLRNEPGLVAGFQRAWHGSRTADILGKRMDLTPHLAASLGNVFTYAGGGATVRFGDRLPDDPGPPRVQPGLPGSAVLSTAHGFGWHLFAGFEGRAVARNIFLDGNTFRDSRSVDKKPLVGDLQVGIALRWSGLRLAYTYIVRTREFETQEGNDRFGSLSASMLF